MRNILRFFLCLVVAMAFTACSDRLDDYYTAEELAGMKIHLQLPNYSKNLVKTRADASSTEEITSAMVIYYGKDGDKTTVIGQDQITSDKITSSTSGTETDYSFTPTYPSGTSSIAVVTNTAALTEDQCKNLSSQTISSTPVANKPVCWGTASVSDLLAGNSLSLFRMTAKVTVQVDRGISSKFTVKGIKVYNTADKGYITTTDTESPNVTGINSFATSVGDLVNTLSTSQVFYETPSTADFYVIVKGRYTDSSRDGYYKLKLYEDNSSTQRNLIRNHNYIVTITDVDGGGYATETEAANNAVENGISTTVIDDNPPIVSMIACREYELGVCDTRTFNGTGAAINAAGNTKDDQGKAVTQNITVATSYKINDKFEYSISPSPSDTWIHIDKDNATPTYFQSDGSDGSAGPKSNRGAKFVIPVTLDANTTQTSRKGTVTVTSGDLTRTITITQEGYDYLGDDAHKVKFFINGVKQSDDYFGDFLANQVYGVKAADNQGMARDHVLHFPAVSGGDETYSYKIPKLTGESISNVTNNTNLFTVTEDGDYYDVVLTEAASKSDVLWVSSFTIKTTINKKTVTITYPVYHTGVFQNLTSNNQLGTAKTGWFYYGVVEVKGTSGSTYHLLDRNIGATNNGFYSPSTQETMGNEGAKGAYMILTKDKHTENGVVSDDNGITIYCKASTAPHLYVWNGSTKLNGDWPGKVMSETMTIGGTTYYYQTFNESPINIIFNNGNNNQKTGDIKDITASSFYSYDNNTGYKKIIFPDVPNIGDSYMPFSSYFKVPTESYVDDILPTVEKRHTKTGEAYYCYVIKTSKTVPSDVQPAEVYIPVTGYYEGTSYRSENHANIWTCTRLSDYQGFSAESLEYGLWFLYLDINGQKLTNSNIRIVNGSAGRIGINGNGVDAIYNAMPVRGIHKK